MAEVRYSAAPELRHPLRFLLAGLKDLRAAGAMAWRLHQGNIRARHRRSWLSWLWLLVPTLATTFACVKLRSLNVVSSGPTDVPYPVFVLTGTILWQVFVDSLNAPLQQLSGARQLITKSRIPHEAVMLVGLLDVFLNFIVRFIGLAGALVISDGSFGPALLLAPLGIMALALLGLALGLLIAPAGLLYDDVGRGISVLATFWFFLTPIAYPVPADGIWGINPVSPLIQTARAWIFSQDAPPEAMGGFIAVTTVTLATLVLAWLIYRLAKPHLVARLG